MRPFDLIGIMLLSLTIALVAVSMQSQTPTPGTGEAAQTFWLGVATLIVLAAQVWLFAQQLRLMERQREIMDGQRKAAEDQAAHTAAALSLAREENAAAAADRKAAAQINQELVEATKLSVLLSQRSRVGVSHVRIRDIGPDFPLTGEACARNWAGKPARPHRYAMELHVGPLPPEPTYTHWHPADQLLVVGDSRKSYISTLEQRLTNEEWHEIRAGRVSLHFYGRFDYISLGAPYHTGFCVRYLPGAEEFERIYAPKYNEET